MTTSAQPPPHVSVGLRLRAYNLPKGMPGVRVRGKDWRYGSKHKPVPLPIMLYTLGAELAQFYVTSEAVTEPECVEQMREGVEMLKIAIDAYEQALIKEGVLQKKEES